MTPSPAAYRHTLTTLIAEHALTIADRQLLLTEAFDPDAKWVLLEIIQDGRPITFASDCIDTLLQHDWRLLSRLLETLNFYIGHDRQQEIAQLRQLLPTYHQELRQGSKKPPTQAPAPTLFINHVPADTPFAQQLRTDLQQRGYTCHLSTDQRLDTPNWEQTLQTHINQAQSFITILSPAATRDLTLQQLYLFAHTKATPKKSVLLTATATPIPPHMQTSDQPLIPGHTDYATGLVTLLTHLPTISNHPAPLSPPSPTITDDTAQQRAAEKAYLDRLKLRELRHTSRYTPLSGKSHIRRTAEGNLKVEPVVARNEFKHLRRIRGHGEPEVETKRFEDAVPQLKEIRRAVLLGDPGAGKTTTLFKLAADLTQATLTSREAPIPLLFRLGDWREADEPLLAFLRRQLGELGVYLDDLLTAQRAVLLLDGLNEIPVGQQPRKYRQVKQFLAQYIELMVIMACRSEDYRTVDLEVDRVEVAPLDPLRIREYVRNYLNTQKGEALFWKLAGELAQNRWSQFTEEIAYKLEEPQQTFWLKPALPQGITWGWRDDDNSRWENWLQEREHPAGFLLLATNPYMLFMIVEVYIANHERLPLNRGELFNQFVETLLLREGLYKQSQGSGVIYSTPAGAKLFAQLQEVAEAMQMIRQAGGRRDVMAQTTLSMVEVSRYLDDTQRYQAASANILIIGEDVRFSHQLLQEFFAACALQKRVFDSGNEPQLSAKTIWHPNNWWEPTNWEETTILLAGLYSDDCTPVLRWLADAQPELAARCVVESGAETPEATLLELRAKWIPRLTDLKQDPDVRARAAIGRALGCIRLVDNILLDNRPGVGVVQKDGQWLPDLVWSGIVPKGAYTVKRQPQRLIEKFLAWFQPPQEEESDPYYLTIYPITYAQFQCFIESPDVYDSRWWADMPSNDDIRKFGEQNCKFWNSPREMVSWYQATAFCRWLSDKVGYDITLPNEDQWQTASCYPHQKEYPWGNEFDSTKANTYEGDQVGRTTAVGIYSNGLNQALNLYDMSGNVWEWCANKYRSPEDERVDNKDDLRVLRGGSFFFNQGYARVAYRFNDSPSILSYDRGFRVLCRRPTSQMAMSSGLPVKP